MAVKGLTRYQRLFTNVANWQEYVLHKNKRAKRPLSFTTRPFPITFQVPQSLYQVFKEVFMEDFYDIEHLVAKLPHNPVIVDVGANAGFFAALLFSKMEKARVFAYEPMPSNVLLFQQTMAANPSMSTIELHQVAVTGLPTGHIELFTTDTEDNTVVSSIFSNFNGLNNKKISVAAQSLTDIIDEKGLEQIDLLKLDCEGSEYDILYNTDAAILQRVKMMVIEVHQIDEKRNNLKSLTNYLQSIGYTIRTLPVQEGSFYMEAIRK